MNVYLARWSDGDVSIVWATDESEALDLLERFAGGEGGDCKLAPVTEAGAIHTRSDGEGGLVAMFHEPPPR